jgi:signal recognition particle receptor subunit beta
MVFFNYATMQMAAKIVYYGPGLCGKTTNLHYIYQKTTSQTRGEMVSLETETDRTLFFDLLPIDVGVIGGFKTRLQLYTVPGQVFYNTTRKLVLKGADGIVFVADSQKPMLDANIESLGNLRENLAEIGLELDETPVVFQLNKRDLPNALSREDLQRALDPQGIHEFVDASAVTGTGVFETLKLISKLTLKNLRSRMMGDQPSATAAPSIVREKTRRGDAPGEKPSMDLEPTTVPEPPPRPDVPLEEQPRPEPEPTAASVATEPAATTEPETAAPDEKPEPTVKTVRVRSSIDVMAELDALRKKATQGTKRRDRAVATADASPTRTIMMAAGDHAAATRRIRVVVQFESDDGEVLQSHEDVVDVDDEKRQLINLKIDLGADD